MVISSSSLVWLAVLAPGIFAATLVLHDLLALLIFPRLDPDRLGFRLAFAAIVFGMGMVTMWLAFYVGGTP